MSEKKSNSELFNDLWNRVVHENQKVSPCMLAIKDALGKVLEDWPNTRNLHVFADRIGKHKEFIHPGKTLLVLEVTGEWHITNADLELWRDLSFFGQRDYFPNFWRVLTSHITEALHYKRRWQAYERYITNGRLRDEHRRLLSQMFWDMSLWRGDGVSLYVQGKRPFGNSSIEGDMIEALGWQFPETEDEELPTEIEEKCWELFDELQFAIIDALSYEKQTAADRALA